MPREDAHIARRAQMAGAGQARGVAECGVGHAQLPRLAGHELGKARLGSGDRLGQHNSGVIGRFQRCSPDQMPDGDALSRLQMQLGGRLARGPRGDAHLLVQLQPARADLLENDIERHHLGERRRMLPVVRRTRIDHPAIAHIHYDRRIGRSLEVAPWHDNRHTRHDQRRKKRHRFGKAHSAPARPISPESRAVVRLFDLLPSGINANTLRIRVKPRIESN